MGAGQERRLVAQHARGREATLLIRGRGFRVSGTAVEETEEVAGMVAELLREQGRRAFRGHGLSLPEGREPAHEEVMEAVEDQCAVRFRVLRETT